jgi:hypothetical protein
VYSELEVPTLYVHQEGNTLLDVKTGRGYLCNAGGCHALCVESWMEDMRRQMVLESQDRLIRYLHSDEAFPLKLFDRPPATEDDNLEQQLNRTALVASKAARGLGYAFVSYAIRVSTLSKGCEHFQMMHMHSVPYVAPGCTHDVRWCALDGLYRS